MTESVGVIDNPGDDRWAEAFGRLSETPMRIALVVTGGGSGTMARCFRREGASRNFVEGVIPYSSAALDEYLGYKLEDSSTSPAVARTLARIARKRAQDLADRDTDEHDPGVCAGIALVAALPTSRPRRGEDRIHVALETSTDSMTWTVRLPKGTFTRESAETVADEMMLRALTELVAVQANHDYFETSGLNLRCEHRKA